MHVPALLRIFGAALQAWWDDDALRLGASLAYYTLFAIAPVLLVAMAIAGMAFGADAARGEMVGQLDQLVGQEGARAVQSLLEGAGQRRAGVLATVLGSITFVVAAMGAFLELQAALNTIWRVKPNPSANLTAFLADRLRSFGLVVAIGFLLMVSLVVSAALAALSGWLARRSPSIPLVWSTVNVLVSFVVTTVLLALLYRFLPDVRLRWRDVITGAFVTAVLFTIGQQLIGLYLGQTSVASSYGAAGSVMVLLLWVYYSAQILLLGAEFTRVYAHRHGLTLAPESYAIRDIDAGIHADMSAPLTERPAGGPTTGRGVFQPGSTQPLDIDRLA
jgi:membrane protein